MSRKIGEDIERALRFDVTHAINFIKALTDDIAAFFKRLSHLFDGILRLRQCGDSGFLRDRSWIRRAVRLDARHRLNRILRTGGIPDAPSGHRIRLGYAVDDERYRLRGFVERCGAHVRRAIVKQGLVNLIGDEIDLVFDDDFGNLLKRLHIVGGACRIAWAVNQHRFCIGTDCRFNLFWCHAEVLRGRGINHARNGSCEFDLFGVTHPIRRGEDDFVARVADSLQDVVNGMLRATGDDYLRGGIIQAVVPFEFVGDSLSEFGRAGDWRVFS